MTRATPLPPEERRRLLVDATLPLLRTHGPTLSTRQIAEAAGVAEGTIFRVFESKDDLIHTCLTEALSIEHLTGELDAAASDDLPTTTRALLTTMLHHLDDVRALTAVFPHPAVADAPRPAHKPDGSACPRPDFTALHREVLAHVAATLNPHAAALRTTPERAAALLVALSFGAHHPLVGASDLTDPDTLAQLALSGLAGPKEA
ncbi:TetR/AcrR family transcriptional regulator [Propioniciclava soli]|uniref:TetR/AcrR family transcriptional regulator n=1 Tax=Propioniciclava soli TaxID=2775081 RepID=UPI001E5850D7